MKKTIFILIFYILTYSLYSLELKYLGERDGIHYLKEQENSGIKANMAGIFIKKVFYKKDQIYLKIARFKITGIDKSGISAVITEWGKGWNKHHIDLALIDDKIISIAKRVIELLKEGSVLFEKRKFRNSLKIFLEVLQNDRQNKEAISWINRINSINPADTPVSTKENRNDLFAKMGFPAYYKGLFDISKRVYLNKFGYWEALLHNNIILVYIPKGSFLMGNNHNNEDEEPEHRVNLSGFWISKYEISSIQFLTFLKKTDYKLQDEEVFYTNKFPVSNISWRDSKNYCKWLSKKTGYYIDLPTEAQWEKAARGDKEFRRFPWGNKEPDKNNKLANFRIKDDGHKYLSPVISFHEGASPYGVINMAGNISEWVRDWYNENYYSKNISKDPKGPSYGKYKVIRGGSYIDFDFSLSVSARDKIDPESREGYVGFRIILENRN
ncbi:MAG: formylglycine-generating enzyme family protein [Acidobacteriota bacterium]